MGAVSDLTDVAIGPYPPNNGDVLTYNTSLSVWEPAAPQAGASALDDLTDVDFGAYPPDNGEVLTYNSTLGAWEPTLPPAQPYDLKPRPLDVETIAGATFSACSAYHHNRHFRCTSAAPVTISVEADSFWTGSDQWYDNGGYPYNPGPMPTGGTALFGKHGTGNITFVAAPGVVINSPDTLVVSQLHGKVTLMKVGPNTWDLEGNLATA
jgi:hypothetical protein